LTTLPPDLRLGERRDLGDGWTVQKSDKGMRIWFNDSPGTTPEQGINAGLSINVVLDANGVPTFINRREGLASIKVPVESNCCASSPVEKSAVDAQAAKIAEFKAAILDGKSGRVAQLLNELGPSNPNFPAVLEGVREQLVEKSLDVAYDKSRGVVIISKKGFDQAIEFAFDNGIIKTSWGPVDHSTKSDIPREYNNSGGPAQLLRQMVGLE
jgi:hypothetical protein